MNPTIVRTYGQSETLGKLHAEKNGDKFDCLTLELVNNNNEPDSSCIPEGTYHCVYTTSPHLSKLAGKPVDTYEIQGVPNRAGIRIHSANFFKQLLGCCALGYKQTDLNTDGIPDLADSRNAVHDFEKFMNYEQFDLIIRSIPIT